MTQDTLDRDYAHWLDGDPRLRPFELTVVRDAGAGVPTDRSDAPEIRAAVIRRLLLGLEAGWRLTSLGLRVHGARVVGPLDLSGLSQDGGGHLPPLDLSGCVFDFAPSLEGSRLDDLRLDGASFPAIIAKGLDLARGFSAKDAVCPGAIVLEECRAGAGVCLEGLRGPADDSRATGPSLSLTGAVLGGDLLLNGAHLFAAAGERALNLVGACIRNIELTAARIVGRTDALALKLPVQWSANQSWFECADQWAISFDSAEIGAVFLNGSTMVGQVRANGAVIHGQWSANQACFDNPDDVALSLDAAEVGSVFLIGAVVDGAFTAPYVKVQGVINAQGARFSFPGGEAINLFACQIGGAFRLHGLWNLDNGTTVDRPVEIHGQLALTQAEIGGDLAMNGARLAAARIGPLRGLAVDGHELEVKGSILWSVGSSGPPSVTGAVNFGSATVHGDVDLTGLAVSRRGLDPGPPLDSGGAFSRLDLAHVAVSMAGIDIGGNLILADIAGHSGDPPPMSARTDAAAEAAVRDNDATGRPWRELAPAVTAANVGGCFDLSRAAVARDLVISGGRLSASEPDEEKAEAKGGPGRIAATALSAYAATIGKTLRIGHLGAASDPAPAGVIDLRSAACGELADGAGGDQWGAAPVVDAAGGIAGYRLELDRFVYGQLADDRAGDADGQEPLWKRRTVWLRRQFRSQPAATPFTPKLAGLVGWPSPGREAVRRAYAPLPWSQLAATLRAAGRDDDARRVTIAHYDFRRSHVEAWPQSLGSWVLGAFFGYGHSNARILGTFVVIFVAACALVYSGGRADQIAIERGAATPCRQLGPWRSSAACPFFVAADKEAKTPGGHLAPGAPPLVRPCETPVFSALYAIDAFLPVNLKEQDRCDVNPARPVWRYVKALYAILGWVFTPLAALTFAGVLKRG